MPERKCISGKEWIGKRLVILWAIFGFYFVYAAEPYLRLATGSKEGVYYALGEGIAQILEGTGIHIKLIASQGSIENLHWLAQGKVELCFAQSDMVDKAYKGVIPFKKKFQNISAIASLYTEAVHILIRQPLNIRRPEDLKGKRIFVGPKDSGTAFLALEILEAMGFTPEEVQLVYMDFKDAIFALREKRVDVLFLAGGLPLGAVEKIMQEGLAYFFQLPIPVSRHLINISSSFLITTIPRNTYSNQPYDVQTVGVMALLVGRDDLDRNIVYKLVKSLFTRTAELSEYHKVGEKLKISSALKGVSIPLHPGADLFYIEQGVYRARFYRNIMDYSFPILGFLFFVILVLKVKPVRIFFKSQEVGRVVAFILIVWGIGAVLLYFWERDFNENYATLGTAFWSSLINWVNFGSKEPYSPGGKITSIAMLVLGYGGVAWLIGEITSFFVKRSLIGGKIMRSWKDHFVIINWNEKGRGIVEQLRNTEVEQRDIVVVADLRESPLPPQYEVHFISGNPVDEDLLCKADIQLAKAVIILSSTVRGRLPTEQVGVLESLSDGVTEGRSDIGELADILTLLLVLQVRKLCAEQKAKPLIIAEILNPQRREMAILAGMFGGGEVSRVKVVSPQFWEQIIIAQTAIDPDLLDIYEDLLTFGRGTVEIYGVPFTAKGNIQKITFGELMRKNLTLREKGNSVILLGVKSAKEGKLYLNPPDSYEVKEGDVVYAVCDSKEILERVLHLIVEEKE